MSTDTEKKDWQKATSLFVELCNVVAQLRHPQKGCPWDLEQTHESLKRFMIEEAYEAVSAINHKDQQEFIDELGDVLLQVLLHAQIASDDDHFSVSDILQNLKDKLIRRHPHVFGDNPQPDISHKQLHVNWQKIKQQERQGKKTVSDPLKKFRSFPSTTQALKLGQLAHEKQFDWQNPQQVFSKLQEEVSELEEQLKQPTKLNDENIKDEIGELYFTLAQLCRHLKIDPEETAYQGNEKFSKRFQMINELASQEGLKDLNINHPKTHKLWKKAKEKFHV